MHGVRRLYRLRPAPCFQLWWWGARLWRSLASTAITLASTTQGGHGPPLAAAAVAVTSTARWRHAVAAVPSTRLAAAHV